MNIKHIIVASTLFFTATICFASDRITAFVGEIKVLEVGAVNRVAVGNSSLLSTSMLDNGQLLLLAEDVGETTVHIWYSDGTESDVIIQIIDVDSHRIITELETLLADLRGIEVKQVGQKIFLTGTLNCFAGQEDCAEAKVVKTVLEAYKDVINLTQTAQVRAPSILASTKMVSMDVKLTEFNTRVLHEIGIDWQDIVTGPSAALAQIWVGSPAIIPLLFTSENSPNPVITDPIPRFSSAAGSVGIGTDIASVINLFAQTGDAVILAEPRLSARSGGTAEFLAGGEIPIITTSLAGTNVEYKEFGIILEISPVVDDENNIMASISTEVSAVDQSIALDPPGFLTRKTSTEVYIRDGETLVLSGLISRDIAETVDKFPILGDLPIIGALFRSTDWQNQLTEMVIFVTPTVFDAKSEYNQENIGRRREILDDFTERQDKGIFLDRGDLILD